MAREEQEESGQSGRGRERRPPETLPATKWQPHLFQSAAITPAEINPANRPLNHQNDLPFRGLGCITYLRSLVLIRTRKQEAERAATEPRQRQKNIVLCQHLGENTSLTWPKKAAGSEVSDSLECSAEDTVSGSAALLVMKTGGLMPRPLRAPVGPVRRSSAVLCTTLLPVVGFKEGFDIRGSKTRRTLPPRLDLLLRSSAEGASGCHHRAGVYPPWPSSRIHGKRTGCIDRIRTSEKRCFQNLILT